MPTCKPRADTGASVTVASAGKGKVRATYSSSKVMRMSGEMPKDWELNCGNGDKEEGVGSLFSGMIVVEPINPGRSLVYKVIWPKVP